MVTMEPQQTHHDTEVVNDRWDIERGSKWWGGAEETVVRLQLLQGKFTYGMTGRRQKRRQEREYGSENCF